MYKVINIDSLILWLSFTLRTISGVSLITCQYHSTHIWLYTPALYPLTLVVISSTILRRDSCQKSWDFRTVFTGQFTGNYQRVKVYFTLTFLRLTTLLYTPHFSAQDTPQLHEFIGPHFQHCSTWSYPWFWLVLSSTTCYCHTAILPSISLQPNSVATLSLCSLSSHLSNHASHTMKNEQ